MATWLKQSTAIEIKLGPFVSSSDGFTPMTALTIAQADVRLAKVDGDWAQKSETTTAVHEENGWYRVLLNSTDTNTRGTLIVAANKTGALPVWREFVVEISTEIAGMVWDKDASFHLVAGSFGQEIDTIYDNSTSAFIATAVWDLSNGIETGLTPRGALRLNTSALAGKISGAGTATETFRNAVGDSKNRIVSTVDASGNRTAITTDVT